MASIGIPINVLVVEYRAPTNGATESAPLSNGALQRGRDCLPWCHGGTLPNRGRSAVKPAFTFRLLHLGRGIMDYDIATGHTPPGVATTSGGSGPICSACGHAAIVAPRRPFLLRKLLGLPPRPAECLVPEYDSSGLTPMPCGCRDVAHGS